MSLDENSRVFGGDKGYKGIHRRRPRRHRSDHRRLARRLNDQAVTGFRRRPTSREVRLVVGGVWDARVEMSRHTTFKFCLDPTVEQHEVLARHSGASRFAFNQCLAMVKTALTHRKTHRDTDVPWTGFDLINAFNAWKKTTDAGRVFTVGSDGVAETVVTGLAWRREVCQQVFEEAAADLGAGLKSWSDSRSGKRKGKRVGFPRFKKKTGEVPSFRLRNKHPKGRSPAIRVGDHNRPRSVTLPGIGPIAVHDDTRRFGACSPRIARRSCSPPSLTGAAAGGYR